MREFFTYLIVGGVLFLVAMNILRFLHVGFVRPIFSLLRILFVPFKLVGTFMYNLMKGFREGYKKAN